MTLRYDSEWYSHAQAAVEGMKHLPPIPAKDVQARRDRLGLMLGALRQQAAAAAVTAAAASTDTGIAPAPKPVTEKTYTFKSHDGAEITLYHCYITPPDLSSPGPAILHAHGGGMIVREMDVMRMAVAERVRNSGVPFFTVDYRVAPEVTAPTPMEDVYAGLVWLSEHAAEVGVDPARIAVMGESAGGGIVAAVALMARDRGLMPPLAKQILIYPMMDDRNVVRDEELAPFLFWSYEDNITGWAALLGDEYGTEKVSPYAAAARAESVKGLPPTYIDVGGLDVFRSEDVRYANRLMEANIETEFHLYPGVPHAFESMGAASQVTKRATENRVRAMRSF